MIVQIYEVQNADEANELIELGVDHIGVWVGLDEAAGELSYESTNKIFDSLSSKAKKVALCLAQDLDTIVDVVKQTKPDILHIGTSLEAISPSEIIKLKEKFPSLKVMRTIPVVAENSVEEAKKYDKIADYLLLDTVNKELGVIGVSGKIHDWNISKKLVESVETPVILAGGLGPDNVAEAINKVQPFGVDSKTKTDSKDGKGKDLEKVKEFVKRAKSAR